MSQPFQPFPLVLVVDDIPETRNLMRRILERDRLRVVEAATGEEALRTIFTLRPEAVILDLRLPGISGLDVARSVRAHADPQIAATPLLACSASIHDDVRREALDAGCNDFQGKPFDIVAFVKQVRDLIGHEVTA
jgi:CheY-like chemotaxis protein